MPLRLINVADGFASSAVPSDLQVKAGSFVNYASAAAFVTAKGAPAAEPDIFFNTTTNQLESYIGGTWVPFINDLTTAALTLIDGDTLSLALSKNQTFHVQGNVGNISLNIIPFGDLSASEPKDGLLVSFVGLNDSKKVTLTFNDNDFGFYMNFPARELGKGQFITFKYIKSIKRFVDIGANF